MRSVSEPLTFITHKASSLVLVLPRITPRELEMRLQMFEAECRIELHGRHRWRFGARQCEPPLSVTSLFESCWAQAERGSLFSSQDMREAG
jgi:hypothetical protein